MKYLNILAPNLIHACAFPIKFETTPIQTLHKQLYSICANICVLQIFHSTKPVTHFVPVIPYKLELVVSIFRSVFCVPLRTL